MCRQEGLREAAIDVLGRKDAGIVRGAERARRSCGCLAASALLF